MGKRLLIVTVVILVFGVYLRAFPAHQQSVPPEKPLAEIPLSFNGWQARASYLEDWVLDMLKLTEYVQRDYRRGDEQINLYLGYYASQREGAEIHSPTHCLPGSGWRNLSENTRTFALDNGARIHYMEAVYQQDGSKHLFVYWYQLKDVTATNKYSLKLHTLWNALRHQRTDAAFVRISTRMGDDPEKSLRTVESFMTDFLPILAQHLPQ